MQQPQIPLPVHAALEKLKQGLRDLYGTQLQRLYLYGSYARGTAHEGSDVDVLIVLEGPIKPGAEITRINPVVSAICLEHDLLISTYPIPREWLETYHNPFLENVRKEAIAL